MDENSIFNFFSDAELMENFKQILTVTNDAITNDFDLNIRINSVVWFFRQKIGEMLKMAGKIIFEFGEQNGVITREEALKAISGAKIRGFQKTMQPLT